MWQMPKESFLWASLCLIRCTPASARNLAWKCLERFLENLQYETRDKSRGKGHVCPGLSFAVRMIWFMCMSIQLWKNICNYILILQVFQVTVFGNDFRALFPFVYRATWVCRAGPCTVIARQGEKTWSDCSEWFVNNLMKPFHTISIQLSQYINIKISTFLILPKTITIPMKSTTLKLQSLFHSFIYNYDLSFFYSSFPELLCRVSNPSNHRFRGWKNHSVMPGHKILLVHPPSCWDLRLTGWCLIVVCMLNWIEMM